ncbi:MAG: hypothetical protein H7296_11420 [Bacteroidia bacterium]|nr:hypothetical protein [Bacteroidia bacterium]
MFDGIVNVKWFGAIGDDSNDDTDAIQSALDFISYTLNNHANEERRKYGGGTVFLPKGIYKITETIIIGLNCRLIGVNDQLQNFYSPYFKNGGTVIKSHFTNTNKWLISSAIFKILPSISPPPISDLLPYNITLSKDNSSASYYFPVCTVRAGISIENLTIDGSNQDVNYKNEFDASKVAFGGIRLSSSPNSTIRNVGSYFVKCSFMLNTCWASSIEDCFGSFIWYGALVIDCNVILISNCSFANPSSDTYHLVPITSENLPAFIYQSLPYSDLGLNDTVKLGTTGIYCYNTFSISIISTVIEQCDNGISCLDSNMSVVSGYIEQMKFSGIIVGIASNNPPQLIVVESFFIEVKAAFYFGNSAMATLNTILQKSLEAIDSRDNQLYVYNDASRRNITFSNTIFYKRKYYKDIVFTDEGIEGQNYGAVYVNPDPITSTTNPYPGSNLNYGFNENDALETFDAALVRIQNQSTKNPVKVIYIKGAPIVPFEGEGITPNVGAALKNVDIVTIENCDVLITSFSTNELNPRGRIYFEGNTAGDHNALVGQIALSGNVNLYFRNVDIACNTPNLPSLPATNQTLFGLNKSYAKLTFESDREIPFPLIHLGIVNIDMSGVYYLVKANFIYDPMSWVTGPRALLDIKFINIEIQSGAGLSPIQNYGHNLGIDCVQMNSYQYTTAGWQDVTIIRNNL